MYLLITVLIISALLASGSVAEAGSIHGEVKFTGALPKSNRIKVTKDQDYCGEFVRDETYLVGAAGTLKNAVVFLDKAPPKAAPSGKEHILENSGCRFVPRILAMIKGEKLITKNSDTKLHIVHSYLDKRTVFNVSLPFRGHTLEVSRRIDKTGVLQVNCDTHAWMRGYIHVFDHPYFAVSDDQGRFEIPDVPPGKYTLKAWHEGGGIQTKEITVTDVGEFKVVFKFKKGDRTT
ncbi:MAG: hypothetical protein HYU47_05170 [Deltaproteobacteria bacterium]|nr:hypothetical protein [Deltaproteobacteria bacterium]